MIKVEVLSSPGCGKCGPARTLLKAVAEELGADKVRTCRMGDFTRVVLHAWFLILSSLCAISAQATESRPVPFVVQLTIGDSDAQRRAFLQIAKVLEDLGPHKLNIEVIAYEGGIHSLLADNHDTATLLAALAQEGVRFKACRISMRGHGYTDADFPLEVEFVSAGAPEMVRLQMEGYRYWRP